MHLRRSNTRAIANSHKEFVDIGSYIRILIDIYSSSEVDKSYWLSEREKQFYTATVVNFIHGITNPISKNALQIYKKYFDNDVDNPKISDYLNRCRKKNWLMYDVKKKEVIIPSIFHDINTEFDVIDFNLRYVYEKK